MLIEVQYWPMPDLPVAKPPDGTCMCGHSAKDHDGAAWSCMKVVTMSLSGAKRYCTCRKYRGPMKDCPMCGDLMNSALSLCRDCTL